MHIRYAGRERRNRVERFEVTHPSPKAIQARFNQVIELNIVAPASK